LRKAWAFFDAAAVSTSLPSLSPHNSHAEAINQATARVWAVMNCRAPDLATL